MSSPSLHMLQTPPTMDALLDAAELKFMRVARNSQADDGVDESPIEVVIARGVTREVFDAMDEDLLYGLAVELRDDGALVLVEVMSKQHSMVKSRILTTAGNYADANREQGCILSEWQDKTNRGVPKQCMPYLVMLEHLHNRLVPLVVFIVNVEGQTHGLCDMVRKASSYFSTNPSVTRVIGFQFFRPHEDPDFLQIPALAVAFERADQAGVSSRVRILTARSFGNWPLHGSVIKTLVDPPHDVPLEPYATADSLNDTRFTGVVRRDHVLEDIMAWARDQNFIEPAPMVEPMQRAHPTLELPPLELPLFRIFDSAVYGWHLDARFD